MSRQPAVLINFQKRETVFPAFIEPSPLQAARIAEDSSAVQPVRFPAVYMAQRQIIDPLPPQGPKADRSRAACVRGAYVGVLERMPPDSGPSLPAITPPDSVCP